jgi:hypothetical protein
MPTLAAAVERGNPDELLGIADRLCKDRAWDDLLDLKARCLDALDRGKQLWGVAAHIDYRLALEAPAAWAGPIVVAGAGRFTIGPLTEVAASTHTWTELESHLHDGPARLVVAHERAVRGETIDLDDAGLELPLRLELWEPVYSLATYHARSAEFPPPELPAMRPVDLPDAPTLLDDEASLDALEAVVSPWTEESNGRCETTAVEGTAPMAVAALGLRQALMTEITPDTGLAVIAWAGASGGAHGRRRGAAAGRFSAWWTLAALTDAEWPPNPRFLGDQARRLRWHAWSDLFPPTGWTLHLAIEDPDEGLAWAVSAVDAT